MFFFFQFVQYSDHLANMNTANKEMHSSSQIVLNSSASNSSRPFVLPSFLWSHLNLFSFLEEQSQKKRKILESKIFQAKIWPVSESAWFGTKTKKPPVIGTSCAGQSVWQRPASSKLFFRPLRPLNHSLFDIYVREIYFLQQFDSRKLIVMRNNNKNDCIYPILLSPLPNLATRNRKRLRCSI